MRSHRFYAPIDLTCGNNIELPKEASHHCVQVLRYREGALLTLFNGDGFDYPAEINLIEGKRCSVKILQKVDPQNESPLNIHLYQGVARGEKMDLIIQKSVELGISELTPIFTERCNVKLDAKRLAKKQQHWQGVAISACEQSGRAIIPAINPAVQLKAIQPSVSAANYILEPTASLKIKDCPLPTKVNLFIGPEGGFSESDLQKFAQVNAQGLQLGPRVLRTETAGLTAIAVFQAQFGDL